MFPGSPASGCGVLADRDYLVGCLQFEFTSVEDFSQKMRVLHDIEVDPCLDLYFFDIGALAGRYVSVKPSNLWKGNGLLGLEFGAGVFDSRLLREMLESRAKQAQPSVISIQTNHFHFSSKSHGSTHLPFASSDSQQQDPVKTTPADGDQASGQGKGGVITRRAPDCYMETVDPDGRVHKIKASGLLPSLEFPLRSFVYRA